MQIQKIKELADKHETRRKLIARFTAARDAMPTNGYYPAMAIGFNKLQDALGEAKDELCVHNAKLELGDKCVIKWWADQLQHTIDAFIAVIEAEQEIVEKAIKQEAEKL